LWREENRSTRRKTLGARREPTTNSTYIWHRAGIEPGPHWWEASALTTAPSLLPKLSPKNSSNSQIKAEAKQNFTDTDYAFKLYNQTHPDELMSPPKEPKFSDFYQPSEQQKNGELMFVGAGALALSFAAFRFL